MRWSRSRYRRLGILLRSVTQIPSKYLLLLYVIAWILLAYKSVQFSGVESLFLIVKSLVLDTWHVPGSRINCAGIHFREVSSPHPHPSSLDTTLPGNFAEAWDRHFNTPDVVEFRTDYLQNCPTTSATLSAALSSNRLTSPGLGLGSNVNFALNLFFLSQESPGRRFNYQLFIVDWNYVSWTELFHDFTSGSSCPIVRTMDGPAFESVNKTLQPFDLDAVGKLTPAGNGDHLMRELNTDGWWTFFDNLGRYADGMPGGKAFRMKSRIARAFLQLQPELKDKLEKIWSSLTEEGSRGYSAVHIRRSDKIQFDSINFPILLYVRALRRLCHSNPGRCSRTVYVFCDDAEVCADFVNQAKECFHVTDFRQQVKLNAILPWSERSPVEFRHQNQFNSLPAEERLASAQEMIVSIYLAALSDFFVCTYSSNVCRLVALLKHDNIADLDEDILSLDWSNWIMV
ncbi:hypothetical protein BV898_15535 [Hypsibius exemplaris]|uniref:Alpha-(1,6)-fucosyltransferase n=1 Tax=Hypsibius exemplaris TaxID=2072580 RepID=A0A9X6RKC0_HYPEX|nr:hypothetical protein BV898_15535 [Hypsibius exemplaris]